ncbi:hypothetical protein KSP39_PZI018272 [Platanthera zijinensis]|uniref:CCHC-type domain-containing protein n=1 Tax=Platanthera zijinensis TaxID=2320716 RepID=A0AAP0B3L3_9ASPA
MAAKFEVPKYDGRIDFGLWQKRIKAVLVQQGLHKALLGKEKAKVNDDDEWDELDLKAISTIQLCLADEVMYNVIEAENTVDLWRKLEELYMSRSLTNKLYVKKQLYSLRMSDGAQLLDHLNVFNKLVSQLRSMDVKVEEEDQALLLLSSLPRSFDHLVTTILYGKDTLKMEEVVTMLLSNEKRSSSGSSASEGLLVKSRDPSRGRSRGGGKEDDRPRSRGRCHYCKEEGHWKANCPVRKLKGKEPVPQQAAVASECVSDDDVLHVSQSHDVVVGTSDSWIMDTGCSFHMCPNIEWFSSIRHCGGGRVRMGNQSECEISGVGSIRIRMFDGVVRTLTDVRYVPELRKSLLSLGTLEAAGYSYTSSSGYLEVRRGAQTVLRGERFGSLYRLIGTTIAKGNVRREVGPSLELQDTVAYAFQAISSDRGSFDRALESGDRFQRKARKDQRRRRAGFVARLCARREDLDGGRVFAAVEETGRESSQEYPDTVRGAVRLRGLTEELRITQEKVELHSESSSAIRLAVDPVYRARTKHVDVRHRELREFARGGGVLLRESPTEECVASMRERSVRRVKFDLTQTDAR